MAARRFKACEPPRDDPPAQPSRDRSERGAAEATAATQVALLPPPEPAVERALAVEVQLGGGRADVCSACVRASRAKPHVSRNRRGTPAAG